METATAPVTSLDQLDPNQQDTYADYLTWLFSERVELLRGYIRQMAAPDRRHQKRSRDIFLPLGNYFRGRTCQVYQAPFDGRLPRRYPETNGDIVTVVQPEYDNILVYTLTDGRFVTQPTRLATDEAVAPHCFPDLLINLNEVFAD